MAGLLCSCGGAQRSGLPWERAASRPRCSSPALRYRSRCLTSPPGSATRQPLLRALVVLVKGGIADGAAGWWLRVEIGGAQRSGRFTCLLVQQYFKVYTRVWSGIIRLPIIGLNIIRKEATPTFWR